MASEVSHHFTDEKNVVVTVDFEVLSLISTPMGNCSHEEADSRMMLHTLAALEEGNNVFMIRTIDTDVVNLKANELRSTNLENMLSKMVVEIPNMGSFVNQNLNTQTNNNTILPDVGSVNEDNAIVADRNSNY